MVLGEGTFSSRGLDMRVIVKLHGDLRKYAEDGGDSLEIEVEAGATVAGVVAQAGVAKGAAWSAAVNGRLAFAGDPVADGAVMTLFPPMAGGGAERAPQMGWDVHTDLPLPQTLEPLGMDESCGEIAAGCAR